MHLADAFIQSIQVIHFFCQQYVYYIILYIMCSILLCSRHVFYVAAHIFMKICVIIFGVVINTLEDVLDCEYNQLKGFLLLYSQYSIKHILDYYLSLFSGIHTAVQKFGISKICNVSYAHQGCIYLIKNTENKLML